ncbi:antitoxin Xre/MbcA/ParS toxin-binding domain-containing protein [Candidatus Vesicomyidisocius sp. SY067_SCS001]|uniref:antitoxin Xre/MbcA/ParS toxin-binding domain-containing protein n=1 Tax=Candidatus Vesicomyidisocius sp. SY067_SCS001 TaxID=2732590 RepID=UPI001686B255|nr:antitoxin Xre/MbcA/ParS toxin-binding domain-containing protein [Candidatus Vesicomyosocius sp. SY067_SCS001]
MDILKLDSKAQSNLILYLFKILENWHLEDIEQLKLLDLHGVIKSRHLRLYRNLYKSFDFDERLIKRTEIILGINESLGTTFPINKEYGTIWLKRPVKKFKHKTPLELMLSGDTGMMRVWYFLDCTQGWKN